MSGEPIHTPGVDRSTNREGDDRRSVAKAVKHRLFVMEFVWLNAFVQQNQSRIARGLNESGRR